MGLGRLISADGRGRPAYRQVPGHLAPRQANGNLPTLFYLHLALNSTLIDEGVNVGLPYNGKAPDLGAFESPDQTSAGWVADAACTAERNAPGLLPPGLHR